MKYYQGKKLCKALLIFFTGAILGACGGGNSDRNTQFPNVAEGDLDDAAAYMSDSPYAAVIGDCIRATSNSEYCSLGTLPLIGMQYESPRVDDILDQLVVSNQWMGERFEDILRNHLPAEILPLFKGVTAIVIDDDIRPAYFTTGTGAIYLDPAFLWLSEEERATINDKDDFRQAFSDPLDFRSVGRFNNNGQHLYSPPVRNIEAISVLLASLLLHELAHANDFYPSQYYHLLSDNMDTIEASGRLASYRVSRRLSTQSPLSSTLLFDLAGVMYSGDTPTSENLATTAEEMGAAFEPDHASDDYAYSTEFEDTAMLFEEAMMKYFFNVDREMAFTTAPGEDNLCADYIVKWGVKNRVGDADVKPRAQFVVSEILPDLETDLFFQDLPAPVSLPLDEDWCSTFNRTVLDQEKPSMNFEKGSSHRSPQIPASDLRQPHTHFHLHH